MATVTPILDTRSIKKDGTSAVKFRVTHRDRYVMISTGISLFPEQWDGTNVIPKSHKKWQDIHIRIAKNHAAIQETILDLTTSRRIKTMTAAQIKQFVEKKLSDPSVSDQTFTGHMRRMIDRNGQAVMSYTLKRIIDYGGENLHFGNITPDWLYGFDASMKQEGVKANTRASYMGRIRTVFNDAINNDVIGLECYPFRKFKIKTERTVKRSLSIDDLRTIRDWQGDKHERQYTDMFMLIFYLRGINMIDLCNLREIRDGRVEYRRSKTGKLYSVKVEPEAMEIIERYRGKKYLLNILDRYQNYKDYYHRMNRALKKLGAAKAVKSDKSKPGPAPDQRTGLFPTLSTYYARHSWATVAASLDIPKETIAAGLGHEIGSPVTSIYIDFDQRKVDEANRKIIDHLNGV